MKLPSLFAIWLTAFVITGVKPAQAQVLPTPLKKGVRLVTQGSSLTASVNRAALQRTVLLLPITTVPPSTPKMFSPSPQKVPFVCPAPDQIQNRFSLARKQEFLFNTIQAGYIDPHYLTDGGEDFFPYQQACARAQVEGNNEMLGWLQKLKGMQKSLLFSDEPSRLLELNNLPPQQAAEVISRIHLYMKDTTIMMFLGYSWGEAPLHEDILCLTDYNPIIYWQFTNFLQRHPELSHP